MFQLTNYINCKPHFYYRILITIGRKIKPGRLSQRGSNGGERKGQEEEICFQICGRCDQVLGDQAQSQAGDEESQIENCSDEGTYYIASPKSPILLCFLIIML